MPGMELFARYFGKVSLRARFLSRAGLKPTTEVGGFIISKQLPPSRNPLCLPERANPAAFKEKNITLKIRNWSVFIPAGAMLGGNGSLLSSAFDFKGDT